MAKQESNRTRGESQAIILKLPGFSISFTGFWLVIPLAIVVFVIALLVYAVSRTTESMLWVSALLWTLFIGYWSVAAGQAAPAKSSESAASRRLHQLLMYGALALAFVRVPGLDRRWLPGTTWNIPLGLALQTGAALFAVWARRHLGRNWSGAITAKVDHQLIRTGPYKLVRHPIYSGMLGMYLGTALVSGELHGLLAVIIIVAAYWRKVRIEERNLRGVFGLAYDEYQRKTWAVIPGLL